MNVSPKKQVDIKLEEMDEFHIGDSPEHIYLYWRDPRSGKKHDTVSLSLPIPQAIQLYQALKQCLEQQGHLTPDYEVLNDL